MTLKSLFVKYKQIISYLFFGVLSTLLSFLIWWVCNDLLKMHYQIANIVSWIFAVLFAFFTNKLYVFESKDKSLKTIANEILKFYFFRLVTLLVDIVAMYIMVELMQLNEIIAKIISTFIVIFGNYLFSKFFIFKKKEECKKI